MYTHTALSGFIEEEKGIGGGNKTSNMLDLLAHNINAEAFKRGLDVIHVRSFRDTICCSAVVVYIYHNPPQDQLQCKKIFGKLKIQFVLALIIPKSYGGDQGLLNKG